MEELGPVEFDFPLNKNETEFLVRCFFPDEYFSMFSLKCLDRKLYERIEKKAVAMFPVIDVQTQPKVHIYLAWAEGERERLIVSHQ